MSDNIPFDIQMEIIKKVSNVKSLVQFRSVSKQWKSFIDSSHFINGYGARHTQPHSFLLRYRSDWFKENPKYICLIDKENNETLKVQEQELDPFVASPLLKQYSAYKVVGSCHGLLCFYAYHKSSKKRMVVIWNSSVEISFSIVAPWTDIWTDDYRINYGFGVCPITKDPTFLKMKHRIGMPWHVEVFTLSSGVWSVIPSSNLPPQSVELNPVTQVVIDRFIYWGASDMTSTDANYIILSFDLITKEFKVIGLPDSLRNELNGAHVYVAKLRESLVAYGSVNVVGAKCCRVWVMEHDSSFRKLYTIAAPSYKILGFRKNGEPILETRKENSMFSTLDVYDPCSQQIKNLGISGVRGSFFMGSYKESLLLLNHLDSHLYYGNNGHISRGLFCS